MFIRVRRLIILILFASVIGGCGFPKISLFSENTDPLKECVLEGKGKEKLLVIPVRGFISEEPKKKLIGSDPGTIQEVVSQLRKAEKDDSVKGILLQVNTPGGSVTASDILYHELIRFKENTGVKIVAALMDTAASGGYYISLPADRIIAHPTTITGSIGVIFIHPMIHGLMDKIGLKVEVTTSGKNKDMGSYFRENSEEEQQLIQKIVTDLAGRFVSLVAAHRKLDQKTVSEISSGRVYLAKEALELGLIDKIGYLSDAIREGKLLSGIDKDAKVVIYRRSTYADDTIYNSSQASGNDSRFSLINLDLSKLIPDLNAGFYYLWMPFSESAGRE